MIAPDGFAITARLYEAVYFEIASIVQRRPTEIAVFNELYAESSLTNIVVSDFLRRQESLSVFSLNWGPFRVSKHILNLTRVRHIGGEDQVSFAHIKPVDMVVLPNRFRKNELAEAYLPKFLQPLYRVGFGPTASRIDSDPGPEFACFEGSYLTFHEECYPARIEDTSHVFSFLQTGRVIDQDNDQEIIKEIIKFHDEGSKLTRDEIKNVLAPNIKHEAWKAIWKEAGKQRPNLSKPGPKRSKNSS